MTDDKLNTHRVVDMTNKLDLVVEATRYLAEKLDAPLAVCAEPAALTVLAEVFERVQHSPVVGEVREAGRIKMSMQHSLLAVRGESSIEEESDE